jgi:1,2-dihydroxy-3-keto-5-methylthiopentene dioxygenase
VHECKSQEVLTVSPDTLNNFEALTKKFFTEHLHEEEEIRFILDGIGYEDVKDFDGQWIRIEIKKGDLIVLPPGMYHRFTLDENNYLKV